MELAGNDIVLPDDRGKLNPVVRSSYYPVLFFRFNIVGMDKVKVSIVRCDDYD